MNVEIGDIYWFTVYYPATRETEIRPVVILDIVNDKPVVATFAEITGSSIKSFDDRYDKWQVPLFNWSSSGLKKGSYVKANCVATVDTKHFKRKDYIGKIHPYDFKNVVARVEEFINSGEEPW